MKFGLGIYLFLTSAIVCLAAPPPTPGSGWQSNCPYLRGKKDPSAQSLLRAVAELQDALSRRCKKVADSGSALRASLAARQGLIQQQQLNQYNWKLAGGKGAPPISNDTNLVMQDVETQASSFFVAATDCVGATGPQRIKDQILNATVQTADILSSFSAGGGFASTGVALGGDLMAGVMAKLIGPDASLDPKSVGDSSLADSYACLYVSMFSRLFGCDKKGAAKPFDAVLRYPQPTMQALMFGLPDKGASVRKLTSVFRDLAKRRPEDLTTDLSSDPILKDLQLTMEDPVIYGGRPIRMHDFLVSLVNRMKSMTPPRNDAKKRVDRMQLIAAWLPLDKFIKAYDSWLRGPQEPEGKSLDEEAELKANLTLNRNLLTSILGTPRDEKSADKGREGGLDLDSIIGLFYDRGSHTAQNPFRQFQVWESRQPDPDAYYESLATNYELSGRHRPDGLASGTPPLDNAAKDINASFRNMLNVAQPLFAKQLHFYDRDYNLNIGNKGQPGRKVSLWESYRPGDGLRALRAFFRTGSWGDSERAAKDSAKLREERMAFFEQTVLPYANFCLLGSAFIISSKEDQNPVFRLADHSGDPFFLPHEQYLKTYQTACKMFDCRRSQGWSGIEMFDEKILPGGADTDQVSRFKVQQCRVLKGYDETMDRFVTNFLETGYPCGAKPGGQLPGGGIEENPAGHT